MARSGPLAFRRAIRRLARDTRGVALVEFAMTFPFLLLVFAVIIEGSRIMWSYQSAITGVRDATRYLARVVPSDICAGNLTGASVTDYQSELNDIVGDDPSRNMFPSAITVSVMSPSLACEAGPLSLPYRNNPAPVVTVSAQMTIDLPFAGLFTLVGGSLPDITTVVTDESRIFGS